MLIEKDYCDYETCVALRELGYKVPTSAYYMPKNSQLIFVINQFRGGAAMDCFYSNNSLPKECMASDFIDAPTMWEAQKWLREEKQIDISITLYVEGYAATIKHFYVFEGEFAWKEPIILQCCKSPEDALSEGIKEAVKILKEK